MIVACADNRARRIAHVCSRAKRCVRATLANVARKVDMKAVQGTESALYLKRTWGLKWDREKRCPLRSREHAPVGTRLLAPATQYIGPENADAIKPRGPFSFFQRTREVQDTAPLRPSSPARIWTRRPLGRAARDRSSRKRRNRRRPPRPPRCETQNGGGGFRRVDRGTRAIRRLQT